MMLRLIALLLGFLLDLCFGDPLWLPHPVVAIGKGISAFEKYFRPHFPKTERGQLAAGAVMAVALPLLSFGLVLGLLALAGLVHPLLRLALESYLCYQILATKSLLGAGRRVYSELEKGDLPAARRAVGGIVGRDTEGLDEQGVIRATVESLAESSSDGIIAPMLYFLLGGAPLAMAYKAVNTMDSMVGYKNERYLYFGRAAARLDDLANLIPARLTALLMTLAARFGFDGAASFRVWRRDHANHTSPNAGHPEAACAGAMGLQLGGESIYFGKTVSKPTMGDDRRPPVAADVPAASRLVLTTAVLGLVLCCVLLFAAAVLGEGFGRA